MKLQSAFLCLFIGFLSMIPMSRVYAGAYVPFSGPWWFFDIVYENGTVKTYPVQLEEFEIALPYGGRVLKTEQTMDHINTKGQKFLSRKFTASLGSDVLGGIVYCNPKLNQPGKVAGEAVLNFSGGNPASTPKQIKFYCKF
jgi:hypothetical protein